MSIPFIDLQAQRKHLEPAISDAIQSVLDRGAFIQGPEVQAFEANLAAFTGAKHVVSCANGTDALTLVGMAEGVGPGDAVFVPAFTFVGSAEAFSLLGATPYFVDVMPDTFNMDPESLKAGIVDAQARGLKPKMVVPVDLFGQPADYDTLKMIVQEAECILVADAAQGLGGEWNGQKVGTLADYTTTSFFPAKPLGCYGDGGAVMCADEDKAALIKSLTLHGKGMAKYDNVRVGLNSRLDTLQAAILIEKLKVFGDEIIARNNVANRYNEALSSVVEVAYVPKNVLSSWAQYTLKIENRNTLQAKLKEAGVPSAIYYPVPLNQQTGYVDCPVVPGGVPVSEQLSASVLSLPMHPYLDQKTQDYIIKSCIIQ